MIVEDVAQTIREQTSGLPDIKHKSSDPYLNIVKDDITIRNEMWSCTGLRKIHLETCKTNRLDVLHCVLFPDPSYKLPIFGCDIVANDKTVTAAIVDVSPVHGVPDKFYEGVRELSNEYNFKGKRPIPLWGDDIFW